MKFGFCVFAVLVGCIFALPSVRGDVVSQWPEDFDSYRAVDSGYRVGFTFSVQDDVQLTAIDIALGVERPPFDDIPAEVALLEIENEVASVVANSSHQVYGLPPLFSQSWRSLDDGTTLDFSQRNIRLSPSLEYGVLFWVDGDHLPPTQGVRLNIGTTVSILNDQSDAFRLDQDNNVTRLNHFDHTYRVHGIAVPEPACTFVLSVFATLVCGRRRRLSSDPR